MIDVLHVLTSLGRGGAERALTDLIARSDPRRFRHIVCHFGSAQDLAGEMHAAGAEIVSLGVADRPRPALHAATRLRQLIRERAPKVVQSALFEANVATRLAVLGSGIPNICWIVSMEYDPASVRAAGWPKSTNQARRFLDAATAKLAGTRFVACSDAVSASAIERLHIHPGRVQRIYNPVAISNVTATAQETRSAREALGLSPESFLFLSIGRLDAPKDHDTLLRSFARLAADRPEARLVIVGKGPLEAQIRGRADELGIRERFRLLSGVPRIAPYLAVAKAFVFPSRIEGLPVALLEAMTAGLACIASAIPPHEEVVTERREGLLFRPGDDEALCRQMYRLMDDSALARDIGMRAHEAALARFSTQIIIPQWEQLWEECASS